MNKRIIFWFRRDLRLTDNPGLTAAAKAGTVIPIYVMNNNISNRITIGSASKWWLYQSLKNLNQSLNYKLNFYLGDPEEIILQLVNQYQVSSVYWNRCYDPSGIKKDTIIKKNLQLQNVDCKSFNASLLWEPWDILKADGNPYKVYTYFYRNGCLKFTSPRKPLNKPEQLFLMQDNNNKYNLDSLSLLPKTTWYHGLQKVWQVGEIEAYKKLNNFLTNDLQNYKENRNYPEKVAVSKLSPHLAFGEISPHQIWDVSLTKHELNHDLDHFLSEIGWREFSYYLLYHFPELPSKNFQPKFDKFPWKLNNKFLALWQQGQTGYPLVDAGMRELWQTGYIHNRVRMVVASFLVKNLLIDWRYGEKWFWDCLVDADLANNVASWQWVAGCGADAAPYFRIFNPITQGEKFDFDGIYTKKFVPELNKLPNKYLFAPWKAPAEILQQAGVVLGKNYPKPIVDLIISRDKAMAAYKSLNVSPEKI